MATYNTNGVTSVPADEEDKIVSSGLGSKPSRSSRARTADVSDNEVNPVTAMFRDIAARFTSAGATLSAPTRPKASTYRPDSGGSIYDGEMFDVPAGVPAPLDRNVDVSAIDSALEDAFSNAAVPQLYLATLGDPQPETTIDVAALRAPDPITVTEITVKAGDTLTAIAKENGVPVQDVIDANPQIKNPNMIRPGDVVSVPDPRFEDVPKPRGVSDSPRLSDSTVTPTGTTTEPRDGPAGLMSPPAQDAVPEVATQTQGLINRPLTAEERTALSDVGGMAAKAYLEDKGLDQDLFDSFEATSTYAKQKGWSTQKTPHVPMFTSAEKRKAMTVLDSVADSVYEDAPELVAALKTIMDHESGGKLAELGYAYLTGADLAAKINASNNPTSTTEQRSRLRALTAMENSAEYRNGDREKKDMMIFDVYYDDQHRSDGYKMGNTEEGDGSKYRGRGIIQLTGKNNYKKYGDMIGVDLVNNPDYMQNRPDVMIAASLAYLEDKGLNEGTLSARKMAKVVGHADSEGKPEARARWDDVISSIEAAGNQALADDMRLNDEYLAQETVGATVDGIIGTNSEREMTNWLGRPPRNITVPEGTSTLDLVRMVNMESNP